MAAWTLLFYRWQDGSWKEVDSLVLSPEQNPVGPSPVKQAFEVVDVYLDDQCQLRLRYEAGSAPQVQWVNATQTLEVSGTFPHRLVTNPEHFCKKLRNPMKLSLSSSSDRLKLSCPVVGDLSWSASSTSGMPAQKSGRCSLVPPTKPDQIDEPYRQRWLAAPTQLFAGDGQRVGDRWQLVFPGNRRPPEAGGTRVDFYCAIERRAQNLPSQPGEQSVPLWRLHFARQLEYYDDVDQGKSPDYMSGDLMWGRAHSIDAPAVASSGSALMLHDHGLSFGRGDLQLTQAWPWMAIRQDQRDLYTFGLRAATVRAGKALAFGADDILRAWQSLVAGRVQGALETTDGGESFSLVPSIERAAGIPQTGLIWQMLCEATAGSKDQNCTPRSPLRIRAQAVASDMPIEAVKLAFHGLRDHAGAPLHMLADLRPERDGWGPDAQASFRLALKARQASGNNQPIALGAFDLRIDAERNADLLLRFAVHSLDGRNHLLRGSLRSADEPEQGASLPLAAVQPASLDPLPEEISAAATSQSRGHALVVSESIPGQYTLRVLESYEPGRNRSFSALLERNQAGDTIGAGCGVIIDPAPCFIAQVDLGGLAGDVLPTSNHFATYERGSDGSLQWSYVFSDPRSRWTLPPQAIGEAYEYREDIGENQLIDYRLGIHAGFSLPQDAERHTFALLPTNWRHILGYPGQPNAGAGLDRASFELLYGLQVNLAGRGLRIVEHGAERGRPASRWEYQPSSERRHWNVLRDRVRHRLAALTIRQDGERWLPLQPDAPSYVQVRENADLEMPGESSVPPKLKGALYWPIRSANIRNMLKQNDGRSSSGRLNQVALTALGGYGEQLARFAGDRLGIETRTSQGRVSFHAVEVIGRIGSYWNRAKYVVIYERTVARRQRYAAGKPLPSGKTDNLEEQHELRGRAIVRKVAEFVEILELERRYPDVAGSAADGGPLRGIRFRSVRIPVSDQWSREIGTLGWAVPLWRPPADPGNPSPYERLFPKPQVGVALADSRGDEFWADINDPDNLVFFAYTSPGADDRTDSWPAIVGIDRVEGPLPTLPERWNSNSAGNAADLDRPSPPPVDVIPRFAPCTWRLAPVAAQADVLAGRTSEALGAAIDVITLMRGSPSAASDPAGTRLATVPGALAELIRLGRTQAEAMHGQLDRPQIQEQVRAELRARLPEATGLDLTQLLHHQTWEAIVKAVADPANSPCELLKIAAGKVIDRQNKAWEDQAEAWKAALLQELQTKGLEPARDELDRIAAAVDSASFGIGQALDMARNALDKQLIDPVDRLLTHSQQQLASLRQQISSARLRLRQDLRADRQRVQTQLREWQRRLTSSSHALLAQFEALIGKLESANDPLKELARKLRQILEGKNGVKAKVSLALSSMDTAITAAEQASGDVMLEFEKALTAIDAAAVDVIGEADGRLREMRNQVAAISGRIDREVSAIQKTVSKYRELTLQRLAGLREELDPDQALSQVERAWEELLTRWESEVVVPVRSATLDFIDQRVCPLLPTADDLMALLEPLRSVLEKLADGGNDLLQAIDDAVDSLDAGLDSLRAQADRLVEQLDEALKKAGEKALRLLRAVGRPPELPGLSFNLPRIEFRFNPDFPRVDITPLTSYFAQAGDYLKSLGLRFPTISLGGAGLEMPEFDLNLPRLPFDLNAVLPDFSGIKLDGLFDRIKLPRAARDQIKIKHGIDKQRRVAWAQADVDMPLGGNQSLFSAASVEVRLLDPRFIARSRLEIDQRGRSRMQSDGRLEGDIQLLVAGTSLVRMLDCQICFDDSGDFEFKFDAKNLQFDGVMLFLSGLMKLIPGSDSPFFPELLERNGRPYGIETKFNLAPPDLQFGTFGISGMEIQMRLRLTIEEGGLFRIGTFVALGSPEKPFTITVFILGGSGWVNLDASYLPARREVNSVVSVALGASATLAIRFGPIAGHVQIFFGIRASFYSGRGGFAIAALLILNGGVVIFGFVHVGLHVRLEIEYRNNGALIGHGVVALEVRISRFFKRKVRQRIRHEFKRGSGARQQSIATSTPAPATLGSPQPAELPVAAAEDRYAERIASYRTNRV